MSAATSRQPAYAPQYYYRPSLSVNINLDEEVKIADSAAERDIIDSLAEIYGIIRTLDGLEKAYVTDAVTEAEYTEICSKLLKQYNGILNDENVTKEFVDLDTFCRRWEIECPRATKTLRVGMPLPEVQPTAAPLRAVAPTGASGSLILTATENFITFLDALRLNMVSKSSLHPLLTEVIQSVNKVTDQDFENRGKIIQWLITLNQMKTSEELNEEQARDLAFDMEQAYNGFKATIH